MKQKQLTIMYKIGVILIEKVLHAKYNLKGNSFIE